ncbi:hypothetical protein ACFYM2_03935 [Streptomyces sp. NPDC006711]|uniref:hypothetical protein n=1 Tax=unclassified Streptomyces TaxID=2593676 RepID=UPI0033C0B5A4
MVRSRAPRRRLTAVLLTVLGVLAVALCGPVPTASAAPAASVARVSAPVTADRADAPVFRDRSGTPGCRQGGRHQDSDPAAPVRVRPAHDHAPVLEDRVPPAALGALYAAHRNPPVRGPTLSAPTPVELSVLRV